MLKWMKYINKAATEVPEGYDTSNAGHEVSEVSVEYGFITETG
ncbi:MAG: hypothetical protein ACLVG5_09920 [Clostridium sp.]